jgi:hypothetical protein
MSDTNYRTTVLFFYYYYLVCRAIGTAATPGLLNQPRVIVKMIVEKQMECTLTRETEVLRENLPQRHFCPPIKSHMTCPGFDPGSRRGGKPATVFLFGLCGHWHCDHSWPIVPASGDSEDDCGEADGM